jgi:hypothetical protein
MWRPKHASPEGSDWIEAEGKRPCQSDDYIDLKELKEAYLACIPHLGRD